PCDGVNTLFGSKRVLASRIRRISRPIRHAAGSFICSSTAWPTRGKDWGRLREHSGAATYNIATQTLIKGNLQQYRRGMALTPLLWHDRVPREPHGEPDEHCQQ